MNKSGLVPEGDVRLVANIQKDIHRQLKHCAVDRKTTVGELVEQAVSRFLFGAEADRAQVKDGRPMLKIHPAPKALPTRILTAELRETLPHMRTGEYVIVPLNRGTAEYNARKAGVSVLIEEAGVPAHHVRVTRR